MYAVIRSGGKQYRVEPGKTIRVETLEGKLGGKITFEDVLSVQHGREEICLGGRYLESESHRQDRGARPRPEIEDAEVQNGRAIQYSARPPAKLHCRSS